MTVAEACALLQGAAIPAGPPRQWMDLGCGSGTFTLALAELLPPGSSIVAVDRDADALRLLPMEHHGVRITTQMADVAQLELGSPDGVLMANVLHFIADQRTMVGRLAHATAQVLLVEYDRTDPLPPWVPYPLPRNKAIQLFQHNGFPHFNELGTRLSSYGPEHMYALSFMGPG